MARNVVEKIELNLSALNQLIGTENVENVKKRIGDLLVARVRSDLRSYDNYLFYPADYYDDYYWVARDYICVKEGFINFQEK